MPALSIAGATVKDSDTSKPRIPVDPEARWPALIAVLAAGGLYAALPGYLSLGPRWLAPAIAVALAAPAMVAQRWGYHRTNVVLGHVISAALTALMLGSVVLLVTALPARKEAPKDLLRSAAALWATNVLVFALWYWRLDAGGPHQRELKAGHETGAFLFPQMTLEGPAGCEPGGRPWSPRFIDYFFLAFNTSTAFSPTDSPVLGRWAKVLMMTQATISLTIVVLLIGRGVNIL
jgi:hypothetical protein